MKDDDDLFSATRQLATNLRAASTPLLIVGVIGTIVSAGAILDHFSRGRILFGLMTAILLYGVAHQVAAWYVLKLRRWAMQLGLVLASIWLAVGGLLLISGAIFLGEGGLFLATMGLVLGLIGFSGVSLARLSMRKLDEDDGWSTNEPVRPKGFEVLTAQPEPPPPPAGRGEIDGR